VVDSFTTGAITAPENTITYTVSNSTVWPAWAGTITGGTSTTSAYAGTVWLRMVDGGTSSVSATNYTVAWESWTSTTMIRVRPAQALTPEQIQRDEHRNWLLSLKEGIKRKRARRRIIQNANTLLESILSPPQRLELKRYDSVTVIGSNGGAFRVVRDWQGGLWQLDPVTMNPVQKLCIHASMDFPSGDRMATLVLWLQADEKAVLAQANRHPSTPEELRKAAARRRYGGWRAVPAEAA